MSIDLANTISTQRTLHTTELVPTPSNNLNQCPPTRQNNIPLITPPSRPTDLVTKTFDCLSIPNTYISWASATLYFF